MITLKDIAKKLNVSVSTVSKALNDSPEIGEATKVRIKEIANIYGYKPNKVALSLKQQNTKTIGVIIPDILNRFFATALHGIEKEASQQGYQIITCLSNETINKEITSLDVLSYGSVDGIIMAVSQETQVTGAFEHIEAIQKKGIPIVLFDRDFKEIKCDKVVIDDEQVMYDNTIKLLDKGKKHIGFISDIYKLDVGQSRFDGYKAAMKEKLGHLNDNLLLHIDQDDDFQEKITAFITSNPEMDAIISADNESGTIAINVAKKLDLDVPNDIAVIGFSDEVTSNFSIPKLSYLYQDARKIGRTSIKLLVNRLQNPDDQEAFITKNIDVTLITNDSV